MKNIMMREIFWHLVSSNLERAFVEQDVVIASQYWMWALAIINILLKEVIPHIFHLDSPDEVWNVLKELDKSTRNARRLFLRNKFYKMSMQETSNMVDFLFTIKDLLGQIAGVGDVMRDEDVILTVLNALLDSYENFVQNVLT